MFSSRSLLALCAILITHLPASAQADDVASWLSAGFELPVNADLSFSSKAEIRISDRISTAERKSIEVGTDYELFPWLKFDAGYKYMTCHRSDFWYDRHQARFSIYEVLERGPWEIELRERWEYTYTPESHDILGNGDNQLRTLLQAHYHPVRHAQFVPFSYIELFNNEKLQIIRLCVGLEYSVNAHNRFTVDYMHQDKPAVGERNSHVIECNYRFKF